MPNNQVEKSANLIKYFSQKFGGRVVNFDILNFKITEKKINGKGTQKFCMNEDILGKKDDTILHGNISKCKNPKSHN